MSDHLLPRDLAESRELYEQLFQAVAIEEQHLAGGTTTSLGPGGRALESLRETRVSFGNPRNDLVRLTPKLFEEMGIELTETRRLQMLDQFDFYNLTLSVSLQPSRGAQLSRVECSLDFGPKGDAEPIIQTMFPTAEWRKLLELGVGLKMGLTGDLSLELEDVDVSGEAVGIPGVAKGEAGGHAKGKLVVTAPNFTYTLGRPEIVAVGAGGSHCFWRIDKPTLKQTQDVLFAVVVKVPRGTPRIELRGLASLEPDFNWLAASLRDVFEFLGTRLQEVLRRKVRLPIGVSETWELDLPR